MQSYKIYAVENLSTGKISLLHAAGNAEEMVAAIYGESAELIGELPKDESGAYIMPNKKFRDEWRRQDSSISVDLSLAKEKRLEEIRQERDKLLLASDAMWTEAHSKGLDLTSLSTYKDALRDMPASVESDLAAISSVEDLEAYQATFPTAP